MPRSKKTTTPTIAEATAEAAAHTYDNPAHNILRKCIQLDMMEQLGEHNSSIDPDSHVLGYALRGSNSMMIAGDPPPIPRNPRDMDLVALGNSGFEKEHAEPYILGQLHDAAKAVGAKVDFYKVPEHPDTSVRSWIDNHGMAPIMLGHKPYAMKKHGYVAKIFKPEEVAQILEHPGHYLLQPRERDVLAQEAAKGNDISVTMEIDLNMGIPHHSVRPIKPVSGQRLRAKDDDYQGLFINAPAAELMEKLLVINRRQKDLCKDQGVAMTMITTFNLFKQRLGGKLTDELVEEVHTAFRGNPEMANYMRRSLAASDWRGLVEAIPRNDTKPLTDEQLDKLQAIYDQAYESHLLHKKLSRDDIKEVVDCTLALSEAILSPRKSMFPAGRGS